MTEIGDIIAFADRAWSIIEQTPDLYLIKALTPIRNVVFDQHCSYCWETSYVRHRLLEYYRDLSDETRKMIAPVKNITAHVGHHETTVDEVWIESTCNYLNVALTLPGPAVNSTNMLFDTTTVDGVKFLGFRGLLVAGDGPDQWYRAYDFADGSSTTTDAVHALINGEISIVRDIRNTCTDLYPCMAIYKSAVKSVLRRNDK